MQQSLTIAFQNGDILKCWLQNVDLCKHCTLREESSQTNAILQYKLLASILREVCSVIQ